jgi:hypothetical protein
VSLTNICPSIRKHFVMPEPINLFFFFAHFYVSISFLTKMPFCPHCFSHCGTFGKLALASSGYGRWCSQRRVMRMGPGRGRSLRRAHARGERVGPASSERKRARKLTLVREARGAWSCRWRNSTGKLGGAHVF